MLGVSDVIKLPWRPVGRSAEEADAAALCNHPQLTGGNSGPVPVPRHCGFLLVLFVLC